MPDLFTIVNESGYLAVEFNFKYPDDYIPQLQHLNNKSNGE